MRRALPVRAVPPDEAGSILLLVLFVCLAIAVVVQTLATVALCAQGESADEVAGRSRLAENDESLAFLRWRALRSWQPGEWTLAELARWSVEGRIVASMSSDWVMQADVREDPETSGMGASARVERGRDGIDLPVAALVAAEVRADPSRETPWLGVDAASTGDPASATIAYVCNPPSGPLIDAVCVVVPLPSAWRLDPGWLRMADDWRDGLAAEMPAEAGASGAVAVSRESISISVIPLSNVLVLGGRRGEQVYLDDLLPGLGGDPSTTGRRADSPLLVVVAGGVNLDARDLGELYGVVVVDDGSVRLDGTTLHGAVFATGTVDLGARGRLLFSRPLLRWATDGSLRRVRLVPGSRWEGTR